MPPSDLLCVEASCNAAHLAIEGEKKVGSSAQNTKILNGTPTGLSLFIYESTECIMYGCHRQPTVTVAGFHLSGLNFPLLLLPH
jgi:hypothetical protein